MALEDIGIIAPAYNVAPYIEDFFSCLEAQTYQGYHLIVVDDCSSDGSYDLIRKHGAFLGDRLTVIRNEANMGPGPARNVGLDNLSSDQTTFVTFLDLDDWFEPEYLEDLHTAAVASGADLTISGVIRFEDTTDKVLATEMVEYGDALVQDSSQCDDLAFINTCLYAKLFRFSGISKVRFKDIRRSEDTCYLFESLPHLKKVKFTNRALYHYRAGHDSLSNNIGRDKYEGMHRAFAEMLPNFNREPFSAFRELFECQVFIRSSVGGVTRLAFGKMSSAPALAIEEKRWLDDVMPSWRKNKYLSFGKWKSKTKKQLALKLSASLYKMNIFVLFIFMYYFVSNVLKKEVRA